MFVLNKQKDGFPIRNIELPTPAALRSRHGALLANNARAILCGASGCGKTNLLFNLLTAPNGLKFQHVYLYTKTPNQPKYQLLQSIINDVSGVDMTIFTENDAVMPPEELKHFSVCIFDDVVGEKQKNISHFFTRGRHNNLDSFYLTQTYTKVPKQLIRDNANLIIVYKQDETNIKHIFDDHCCGDNFTFAEFKEMCGLCWNSGPYGFLTIAKDFPIDAGRYRQGMDVFIKRSGASKKSL